MLKHIEFLYDFGSPTSYIAYKRLPAIAARTGATIDYQPILLGGVFKGTGNQSPMDVEAKAAWFWGDLQRFAKRYEIPLQPNRHFPINTLYLMRGAVVAQREDRLLAYSDAVFDAIWAQDLNLGDPKQVVQVLNRAEFDAKAIFAAIEELEVKAELKQRTDTAIARGAFGAPTFFVDGTMFFGQDRLDIVEEHLAR